MKEPHNRCQIVVPTFFEGRKRADVAPILSINVHIGDNPLHAAFDSLRCLFTQDADAFTDVGRSLWFDLIEERSGR
ncbi:MAG TPA: hypothetical protein VJO33_06855 [Gemmatimonadaceae bacterium]|nr:hypothetical protein [Gemmatimonadaceae bacterium]